MGEAGTGKTTLVRAAIDQFEKQGARFAYLNNPTLTRDDSTNSLPPRSTFRWKSPSRRSGCCVRWRPASGSIATAGLMTALIIDEVQALPDELLEEVRLLANMETPSEKLLPIVLSGQPELADRLNKPSLRQLKQRVALRCELTALDARETAEYIAGRIRVAGGNSVLVFTRQAVEKVYEGSGGIPA